MDENKIVKAALSYIEENLEEDLSLGLIEENLCYSRFYINRLFAKETGCTIYKYIQARRLTEAARKLVETELPIVRIAQEAHYNSQQAFTLAFHRAYACTPLFYRRNGAFHPIQPRITLAGCSRSVKSIYSVLGGRMAA